MAGLCEGGSEPPGFLKAIETFGPWCRDAKDLLTQIGTRLLSRTGDPRCINFLRQRIGIAVQRGNAASILGSFPNSISRTHRHDTTVHDVIRLLIPALRKNQSDSLMAADGDCHHLCKLMAPVRHRWSINDVIGGIRNTVMPSDCSPHYCCEDATAMVLNPAYVINILPLFYGIVLDQGWASGADPDSKRGRLIFIRY
ncbi:hypothetical protein ANN_13528 [Periplaneta americana]|uniref:Uncharacterized protein n=1 Tax=Periplaneta americana TaxID=6978 RepID=A0ABQ8TJU2_PERAM|nr:hypothetical protein ANN_13528 [Periplaneta americana]